MNQKRPLDNAAACQCGKRKRRKGYALADDGDIGLCQIINIRDAGAVRKPRSETRLISGDAQRHRAAGRRQCLASARDLANSAVIANAEPLRPHGQTIADCDLRTRRKYLLKRI